jgi:hypothetical protein
VVGAVMALDTSRTVRIAGEPISNELSRPPQ